MAACIGWSQLLYLVVGFCVIEAVEIGLMAVLIPPAASVGHGAARDERLRIPVPRGERPSVMVCQRVTWIRIRAEFYGLILHTRTWSCRVHDGLTGCARIARHSDGVVFFHVVDRERGIVCVNGLVSCTEVDSQGHRTHLGEVMKLLIS